MYKNQEALTGPALQAPANALLPNALELMYCPSRRPVQSYPQTTHKSDLGSGTAAVASLLGAEDGSGCLRHASPAITNTRA